MDLSEEAMGNTVGGEVSVCKKPVSADTGVSKMVGVSRSRAAVVAEAGASTFVLMLRPALAGELCFEFRYGNEGSVIDVSIPWRMAAFCCLLKRSFQLSYPLDSWSL